MFVAIGTTTPDKPTIGAIWKNGLLATVIAAVVNIVLFVVGSLFTFPPDAITPLGTPVSAVQVIVTTVLAGVLATIGYTVLTRFLHPVTAKRVVWFAAVVVLLGMFFSPLGIMNAPVAQIVILELMHLMAGLLPVYWLTRS